MTAKLSEAGLGAASAALFFYKGQYAFKTREKETGAERVSYLSPADVRAAFTQERLDTGWIPQAIVRCGSTNSGPFAVGFFPASRHTIGLQAPDGALEPITVPVPALVVLGRKSTYHIWAMATEVFDPRGRLFHAPFPNVFDDGRICFGGNKAPKFSNDAPAVVRGIFLNTPFNGNEAARRSAAHPADVRVALRELAAARAATYPLDDMVPSGAGRTVGAAIDRLIA